MYLMNKEVYMKLQKEELFIKHESPIQDVQSVCHTHCALVASV